MILTGPLAVGAMAVYTTVPGVMKAYSYAMTSYLLHKEPQLSAMDALKRSQSLMDGHRIDLFVLDLSFIGWMLLVIVTFGLAYIWVGPYINIARTVFLDEVYYGANA